jgi:hypothetical protein
MFKNQLTGIFLESCHVSFPSSLNSPCVLQKAAMPWIFFQTVLIAIVETDFNNIIMSVIELILAYIYTYSTQPYTYISISVILLTR